MNMIQNLLNSIRRTMGKPEIYTFSGGIHPKDMKTETESKAVVEISAPDELVFPLSQHIGAPAIPCVEVGDKVLIGQKIAQADGFVSANIHSSVSGTVKAIEPRLHPMGAMVNSIIIENDKEDKWYPAAKIYDIDTVTPAEIIEAVKEAGIVGMGGAAFPTHVKLSPPADKKIKQIIINGAECEPYLTSDHRAMLETGEKLILGLKLTMKLFDLDSAYIAIETNKPDAIVNMTKLAKAHTDVNIKVVGVKTKYPQGSEKHLIKAVTGLCVPPGKLPADIGVIVNNIDSCAAIARAVLRGKPLTRRIVTISGDCIENPQNLLVPIGTSFSYLIEQCGGLKKEAAKLIMGGPMMGMSLSSADVPVIKGSSGLLAFSADMTPNRETGNCLRCGKCVSGCPMNLLPNIIKEAVVAGDIEKLKKLNIMDCVQCGSCTYVCPAEQNPLQYIRTGKLKLREVKK